MSFIFAYQYFSLYLQRNKEINRNMDTIENKSQELKRGNLGYANGWTSEDYENYRALKEEAQKNGWKIEERRVGRCETETICKEGDWKFTVDSSD